MPQQTTVLIKLNTYLNNAASKKCLLTSHSSVLKNLTAYYLYICACVVCLNLSDMRSLKNQVFATKQDDVLTAPPADTKKEAEAVRAAEQVDDGWDYLRLTLSTK